MPDWQTRALTRQAEKIKDSNPEKALKILREAKNPTIKKDASALVVQSYCYLKLGKTERAKAIIGKAIKTGNSTAISLLINILLAQGDLAEAEEAITNAIRWRENSHNYCLRARIHLAKGKFAEAEADARTALNFDNHPAASELLGEALRKQKKYPEALAELEKSRPEKRNHHDCLCRAYCLMHLRNFSESFAHFQDAEKYLARNNYGIFDSRVRLNAGYLFLYQEMLNTGAAIDQTFFITVKNAAQWLKKKGDDANIGRYQRRDLSNALEIVNINKL